MDSGTVPKRVIIIQLAILAGLAAWFKLALPRIEKARAESRAAEREQRLMEFFQANVLDDPSREVEVPAGSADSHAHPQRLRAIVGVQDVMQALGVPDARTSDFRGGVHLTWRGTQHTLEAAFNQGRLYCLRLEDRQTGHGALVFESSLYWHPF